MTILNKIIVPKDNADDEVLVSKLYFSNGFHSLHGNGTCFCTVGCGDNWRTRPVELSSSVKFIKSELSHREINIQML